MTRGLDDDEPTPVQIHGARELLRDKARVVSAPPDTLVSCPSPDCVGGEVVARVESPTGYRVLSRTCALCKGAGAVTRAEYVRWKSLQERTP